MPITNSNATLNLIIDLAYLAVQCVACLHACLHI